MTKTNPETAFYYPGVICRSADWVKSLALFLDKIALLVPDYMKDRPMRLDPAIAAGLEGAGLLTILSPETLVDKTATERLATELGNVIASGALDNLPASGPFAEISWSRLGGIGDPALAEMIYEELRDRGLARESEAGVAIPLHPMVRSLVLVLLAQILKEAGPRVGLDLCPATDVPRVQRALGELIGAVAPAGPADVIEVDLEFVAPDLSAVPMDEVLDFRRRYATQYRAYARDLRAVVRDLQHADAKERESILADRRDALRAAAEDLRRGPLKDIGALGVMALGILAGVAGVLEGSEVSGAIGAVAAIGGSVTAAHRSAPKRSRISSPLAVRSHKPRRSYSSQSNVATRNGSPWVGTTLRIGEEGTRRQRFSWSDGQVHRVGATWVAALSARFSNRASFRRGLLRFREQEVPRPAGGG